jgi:hypothetical protein
MGPFHHHCNLFCLRLVLPRNTEKDEDKSKEETRERISVEEILKLNEEQQEGAIDMCNKSNSSHHCDIDAVESN